PSAMGRSRNGGRCGRGEVGSMTHHPLDNLEKWFRTYFCYPNEHCATAHMLWMAHVRMLERCEVSPRLLFSSPEPGSDKSNLLRATSFICGADGHEGFVSVSVSAAVLARGSQRQDEACEIEIETWGADLRPIFIDEVDKKYANVNTEDLTTTEV